MNKLQRMKFDRINAILAKEGNFTAMDCQNIVGGSRTNTQTFIKRALHDKGLVELVAYKKLPERNHSYTNIYKAARKQLTESEFLEMFQVNQEPVTFKKEYSYIPINMPSALITLPEGNQGVGHSLPDKGTSEKYSNKGQTWMPSRGVSSISVSQDI